MSYKISICNAKMNNLVGVLVVKNRHFIRL
jgi:hypothetical protein